MFANKTRAGVVLAGGVLALTLTAVAQTQTQSPPPAPAGQAGTGAPGLPGRGAPMWEADFSKTGTVPVLSPAEEAKRLWLPPGFKLEPVLSEPDIQEPAQIAFDGNGRMFVLEIRGYMQDADATGELDPVGRISVHEDTDDDGVYETHHVFVDKLVFPRFVTPFGPNAILTKESNADEVWKYTDTNGDGVADKKELFATGFGRLRTSSTRRAASSGRMDNWMYSTFNSVRIRWTPNGVLREPTGANGGQWGVTQDNYGKMWFQAGRERHARLLPVPDRSTATSPTPTSSSRISTITWGAPVLIADMQGGMNAVRMPDGSLTRATGSARQRHLPRRSAAEGSGRRLLLRRGRRAHRPPLPPGQDRRADAAAERVSAVRVHPLDRSALPAGRHHDRARRHAVHHRHVPRHHAGIAVVGARHLSAQTHRAVRPRQGRPARPHLAPHLRRHGAPHRTQPHMLDETPAQLVAHLTHPNGWWRDTAQQLLVLKQDKSVVPALKTMATDGETSSRASTRCGRSRASARSTRRSSAS